MLLYYTGDICKASLWITLFALVCVIYSYWIKEIRQDNTSSSAHFHPAAILVVLFTWPVLLLFFLSLLILRVIVVALLFGLFILLFTLALVGIRKPFLFIWLDKILRFVGDALLKANTRILRLFLSPWNPDVQSPP